jgi:hypothetical protein
MRRHQTDRCYFQEIMVLSSAVSRCADVNELPKRGISAVCYFQLIMRSPLKRIDAGRLPVARGFVLVGRRTTSN